MKAPILGTQTFLADNSKRIASFQKYITEIYERQSNDKPLYTGRYFVILKEGSNDFSVVNKILQNNAGLVVANSNDFSEGLLNESQIADADAFIYDNLGVALVAPDDYQTQILESASVNADFIIEPERIVYLPDDAPSTLSTTSTWGLNATKVLGSTFTGKNVPVAVLDTGFDIHHPDFLGRNITTNSFVPNETIHDIAGHGTHCIGTACGDTDINQVRYGIAKDALIYAGKVLSNQGSGAQAWILNGINWAANNGCKVISMSLGSRVYPGQGYDIAYERAAQFALSKGSVVVAAAGNDSRRSWNSFQPVSSPADCPSILAVGALDVNLNVGDFSNRSINATGQVDIAAPGVDVYSSWPMSTRYRTISGTSMATPHVAGIIALLWEKFPNATPYQIIKQLTSLAKRLPLQSTDVGVGLAIAP